jgi:putative hemolysin
MELFPSLLFILLLLLMESFFSGSEIAIIACDKWKMKSLASEGMRGARLVEKMLESPEWLLGTTMVGSNLAVVVNTVFVTLLLIGTFGAQGEFFAVLIMSPLVLFWGEILPRTFFQQKADFLAPRVIYVLWVASRIFAPFLWVSTVLSRVLAGWKEPGAETGNGILQREDLKLLLRLPQNGSDIQAEERKMVDGLIDLSGKKVEEVMIPLVDVVAVPETATREEAVQLLLEKGHSRLPVFRERILQIVGVLHHFDLLLASDHTERITSLVRSAFFVPETKLVYELFLFMKKSGNNMAIAVDEYGGATGIITLEDILEEIVGEIEDEYDRRKSHYRKIGPSSYLVKARIDIEQLNDSLSLDLPLGDYETLGGFLMSKMGRIPKDGDIFRMPHLVITVEKATPRAVESLRLDIF